jgi:hypothetical protein
MCVKYTNALQLQFQRRCVVCSHTHPKAPQIQDLGDISTDTEYRPMLHSCCSNLLKNKLSLPADARQRRMLFVKKQKVGIEGRPIGNMRRCFMENSVPEQAKTSICNNLAKTELVRCKKAAHSMPTPTFAMVCMRQHRTAHSGASGAL